MHGYKAMTYKNSAEMPSLLTLAGRGQTTWYGPREISLLWYEEIEPFEQPATSQYWVDRIPFTANLSLSRILLIRSIPNLQIPD